MKPSERLYRWRQFEAANESERDRINFLKSSPVPQTDPLLMAPKRVEVLKASFCIGGQPVKLGSILTMPYFDAYSLWVTGKIAFIE